MMMMTVARVMMVMMMTKDGGDDDDDGGDAGDDDGDDDDDDDDDGDDSDDDDDDADDDDDDDNDDDDGADDGDRFCVQCVRSGVRGKKHRGFSSDASRVRQMKPCTRQHPPSWTGATWVARAAQVSAAARKKWFKVPIAVARDNRQPATCLCC